MDAELWFDFMEDELEAEENCLRYKIRESIRYLDVWELRRIYSKIKQIESEYDELPWIY